MLPIDPLFLAFLASAALIIVTPGAATAVVIRSALSGGRLAAVATASGIAAANVAWVVTCCAAVSLVVRQLPAALYAFKWIGGLYLVALGLQSLWQAWTGWRQPAVPTVAGPVIRLTRSEWSAYAAQGAMTNLLNPALVVFYATYLPQFIRPQQSFVASYLLLGAIHIVMAFTCHNLYGLTVGGFAAAMGRPGTKHVLQVVTGAALIALGGSLVRHA